MSLPPIALGYVRVSTGRQELSLEAQTAAVRAAAEYHKITLLELFPEPDISGSTVFLQREQGRALAATAQAALTQGREVAVIVPKVDRLGRDTIDVSTTVNHLHALGAGLRVLFLDINVDTRSPMGRAFMQIAAVFAELELARIRERIQTALDHNRALGLLTGTEPFGWDATPTGEVTTKGVKVRRLSPNPGQQRWILEMHRLRNAGWGYHSIAVELNAQRAPTKTGRGQWQAGNVRGVLTNDRVVAWLNEQPAAAAA
jgi:DNA invertase Pin-like site-specific DNA recombinase